MPAHIFGVVFDQLTSVNHNPYICNTDHSIRSGHLPHSMRKMDDPLLCLQTSPPLSGQRRLPNRVAGVFTPPAAARLEDGTGRFASE